MSRRRDPWRKRAEKIERKRKRKRRDDLKAFEQELQRDGPIEAGMSRAEALNLIAKGMETMAQRLTEEGHVTRAPWGLAFDQRVLQQSMKDALPMLEDRLTALDDLDENTASEEEMGAAITGILGPAITMGAAAALFLGSSPVPFDMAKFLTVDEVPKSRAN